MSQKRTWLYAEKKILLDNYQTKTIKELLDLLPRRSAEAINNQIKRLKKDGKINESKSKDAIDRAYLQRTILNKD